MNTKSGIWKKAITGAFALTLAVSLSAGWTAGAITGYSGGRLSIVTEPGKQSPYVTYYVGDKQKTAADEVWSENGHTGKALSLSGNGEYLEIDYHQLQMHKMTIAGWFYWRGAAKGKSGSAVDETATYSQRFFTLSHSDSIWLSLMPHARNTSMTDSSGKVLDGVYMSFAYDTTKINLYNPAVKDQESYGIPLNEWHFVAVTMDGQSLKLYIDGRLWFQKMLILGVEEMRNNMLTIGSGRWGDPTLNALVDDMAIYSFAMNADQIAMLNAGVDPLAKGATMPDTTSVSLPQAPTTTTTADSTATVGGIALPGVSLWLIGGAVVIFIILSIVLNVYTPTPPPDKSGKGGGKQ